MFTGQKGARGGAVGSATRPGDAVADSPQVRGAAAEDRALAWLLARGLVLIQRNYRLARGPSARGGEIDLVLRDREGTLVFVEVRARGSAGHGGAAASVTGAKRERLLRAARHFLLRFETPPACRFDVIAIDGGAIDWLQAAFDAS